jgi:MFS family permease
MTDTSAPPAAPTVPKPNFEFGDAMGATFGTFFKRPFYFLAVSMIGMLVTFGLGALASTPSFLSLADAFEGGPLIENHLGLMLGIYIPFLIVTLVVGPFFLGLIVRPAITLRLGLGLQMGKAVQRAFVGILPMIAIALILTLPITLGYVLLIVPGLYLGAMFSLVLPAIVFEEKGLAALGRSLSLTQGYRWVLVGFHLVVGVIASLITQVTGFIVVLISVPVVMLFGEGPSVAGIAAMVVLGILGVAAYAAAIGLPYIPTAVAYVRLRQIKEGGGEELLKVFE